MKNYAYGINENEKNQLTDAINNLQEFFGYLINQNKQATIFNQNIKDELIAAWHDMPSHFEEIRVKLAIKDQLALSFHGLTGGQLELKLAIIKYFTGNYRDALSKNGFDAGTKHHLRQLLVSLDTLFYDLIQATNSGSAISSFNKCLLALLE